MDTQCKRILAHLQLGKSITPLQALKRFGCLRLAARIKDLREAGNDIVTTIKTRKGKRYASYSLGGVK